MSNEAEHRMPPGIKLADAVCGLIEGRREDLIALTQDLIRIPTLNPPGNNYLEICEFLAKRLKARGFEIEMVRAQGAPGECCGPL